MLVVDPHGRSCGYVSRLIDSGLRRRLRRGVRFIVWVLQSRRCRSCELANRNSGSVQLGMLAEGLGFEDEASIRHNLVVHLQSFQH